MNATTLIATRSSAQRKARFRALATRHGMDESKLLTLLIDRVLERNAVGEATMASIAACVQRRVTIRLRPGDAARLAERAAERGMKPATYLGALVHAHLRLNPPLPTGDLAHFKRAVAQLSEISRNLNALSHPAAADAAIPPNLAEELQAVRATVMQLRAGMTDLVKANLISWESDDG